MATIHIAPGATAEADLQAAINSAVAGDVITLEAGATYTGNWRLPNKGTLADYITIRSNAPDADLPADGVRTSAAYLPKLPFLQGKRISNWQNIGVFEHDAGADHYKLQNLAFGPNLNGNGAVIYFGYNDTRQTRLSQQPNNLILDRLYFQGHPVAGQKRFIDCHGKTLSMVNCYIGGCFGLGQDSMCFYGQNGEGPWNFENNFFEAAGENWITGGDDQRIKVVTTIASTPAPTLQSCRINDTTDLQVGWVLAFQWSAGTKVEHTLCRSVNHTTGDITFDPLPNLPDVPGNVQFEVCPTNITFRRNHCFKPTAWKFPILDTPANVSVTPSTGESIPAGTYGYRVQAKAIGYQSNDTRSDASPIQTVAVQANGKVTLTWSPVTGAETYRVLRQDLDGTWDYWDVTAPGTTFVDTGAAGTAISSVPSGTRRQVKNLFELKNGRNVQVDSNIFESCWAGVDIGFAIWLKSNSQESKTPANTTRDVVFEKNIIRHCSGFIEISGQITSVGSSQTGLPMMMENLTIRNNLCYDSNTNWAYKANTTGSPSTLSQYGLMLANGCKNLTIDHNTFLHQMKGPVEFISTSSPKRMLDNLVITNNLFRRETYGFKGMSSVNLNEGTVVLDAHSEGSYTYDKNVIAGAPSSLYPANGFYPSVASFENQFENYGAGVDGDFHLKAVDPEDATVGLYVGAGTDGKDIGADIDLVLNATQGVIEGTGNVGPQPPHVTITTLPNAQVGVAYIAQLTGSGGLTPYTWSISTGALPAGLTLDSATGNITGTPTAAGTVSFTATVTDANALTDSESFSITVVAAAVPLDITTLSLANAAVNAAYSATLSASGGQSPYTWSIESGVLPSGITLDGSTGAVTGTPSVPGTQALIVKVTDSMGATDTQALSLTVDAETYPDGRPIRWNAHEAAVFRRSTAPTDADSVMKGDIWIDTSANPPKIYTCNSVNPTVWSLEEQDSRLLGGSHSDTLQQDAVEGDMILAAGTPAAWQRLPIGGAGTFLTSDGVTPSYRPLDASDIATGVIDAARLPAGLGSNIDASQITSGFLSMDRLPDIVDIRDRVNSPTFGILEYLAFTAAANPGAPAASDPLHDASSVSGSASTASLSWSHTCSGANRLLVVGIATASVQASGVTFNGVALTHLASADQASGPQHAEMWYLLNPPAVTGNIVVTLASAAAITAGATSYTNVNQSTPLGTHAVASGNTNTSSVSVSTLSSDVVHDVVGFRSGVVTIAPGSGQTQRWNQNAAASVSPIGAGSTKSGTGGTVSSTWTNTSDSLAKFWAAIAVPIHGQSNPSFGRFFYDDADKQFKVVQNGQIDPVLAVDPAGKAGMFLRSDGTKAEWWVLVGSDIGAVSTNTPFAIVSRDTNGDFAANIISLDGLNFVDPTLGGSIASGPSTGSITVSIAGVGNVRIPYFT